MGIISFICSCCGLDPNCDQCYPRCASGTTNTYVDITFNNLNNNSCALCTSVLNNQTVRLYLIGGQGGCGFAAKITNSSCTDCYIILRFFDTFIELDVDMDGFGGSGAFVYAYEVTGLSAGYDCSATRTLLNVDQIKPQGQCNTVGSTVTINPTVSNCYALCTNCFKGTNKTLTVAFNSIGDVSCGHCSDINGTYTLTQGKYSSSGFAANFSATCCYILEITNACSYNLVTACILPPGTYDGNSYSTFVIQVQLVTVATPSSFVLHRMSWVVPLVGSNNNSLAEYPDCTNLNGTASTGVDITAFSANTCTAVGAGCTVSP